MVIVIILRPSRIIIVIVSVIVTQIVWSVIVFVVSVDIVVVVISVIPVIWVVITSLVIHIQVIIVPSMTSSVIDFVFMVLEQRRYGLDGFNMSPLPCLRSPYCPSL